MAWRPMLADDLETVSRLAATIHPDYPEADAVFADRLALWPEGCWIAQSHGAPVGYLLSHPYIDGRVPELDTELGALPERPDTYYLHDLALLPRARGTGLGQAIVRTVLASAARRFGRASLVAVGDSAPFWQRLGFAVQVRPGLANSLQGYDAEARYMASVLPLLG